MTTKQVRLVVDYGMVSHGLAPLVVDGLPTELDFWGFNQDIVRRLTRLNELYDRQIDWRDPRGPRHHMSDRDRMEFNALLPFVLSELEIALGDQWEIVLDTEPL
jgi:hypothetical protein